MRKIGFFAIAIIIFGMVSFAGADVVTLKANVPDGETLKAYTFVIDCKGLTVGEYKTLTGFAIAQINNTGDALRVTGADVKGVKGPAVISVMEFEVAESVKDKAFGVTVESFGTESSHQFLDKAAPFTEVK
jgi:hypothetical protein